MPRILHLGFGSFHRAHQAWYTHAANAGSSGAAHWAITGVSMRRADLRDALAPEGFTYTLAVRGAEGTACHRIAVHDRILVAADEPHAVLDEIASPEVRIVTLTVTEKGYHLDPATGTADLGSAPLAHDLASPAPSTAIGFLARGLAKRAATGEPVTVVSCDNISGNGHKLSGAVRAFAKAAGLEIEGYLSSHVTFPDTMVDRITPATTDAVRDEVAQLTGRSELEPVLTEAFSEWIIEDRFAAERPDWTAVGVEIVPDVAPFEARKLRLLNAAHSLLAYAGLLSGHRYVHEAIADPALRSGVEGLWDAAVTTLPSSLAPSLPAYRNALLDRFAVPAMRHELAQIAMDGSLKIPVRLVPVLVERTRNGLASPQATAAIAAWLAFLLSRVAQDAPVADPDAQALVSMVRDAADTGALCRAAARRLALAEMPDAWLGKLAASVDAWVSENPGQVFPPRSN